MKKRNWKNIKPGDVFNDLTIIEETSPLIFEYPNKKIIKKRYLCKCKCGNTTIVKLEKLAKGQISCGCKKLEGIKKHLMSNTRIYAVHHNMKMRCYNKKNKEYKNYGARGIKICDEWLGENGFINFYNWAIENGYSESNIVNGKNSLSIDRIDNNGNYEPSNCRWTTVEIQTINKRTLYSKSGYRGIYWAKNENKWVAHITIKHKSYHIGYYKTQKEAVEARNQYIIEHNLPHQKNIYKGELSNGY